MCSKLSNPTQLLRDLWTPSHHRVRIVPLKSNVEPSDDLCGLACRGVNIISFQMLENFLMTACYGSVKPVLCRTHHARKLFQIAYRLKFGSHSLVVVGFVGEQMIKLIKVIFKSHKSVF